jgi:hypothetical protein
MGFFERGRFTTIVLETTDEAAAVRHFLQTVSKESYHLESFADAGSVGKLEAALQHANVPYRRNDIPHEGLMRVFLFGHDLRQAQDIASKMDT